ncbi:hypothetical protein X566_13035 [Afipia sp. P52-10]|nr:hypothetical protein X566_13035 [Afipia sp. P52-10]
MMTLLQPVCSTEVNATFGGAVLHAARVLTEGSACAMERSRDDR